MNESLVRASSITDVSAAWPGWEQVLAVLTFSAGFNSAVVVAGTTFLGIAAGVVGTFALLRNRALMGDALAHSALPGLCIAYLLAVALGWSEKSLWLLLLGATVSGIIGVITVQALTSATRLTEDAAIGAVLSVFFGVGIVLMSLIQNLSTGSEGGLHHFIYGQTAAMHQSDALLIAGLALLSILAGALLLKEFRLVCFDQQFAAVQGWPVWLIDLLMMALVVVVTVTGLQAVGLILVIALLIVPASAARFWTERLTVMCAVSGFLGGLSGYLGASASALLPRLPAGAVIVLTAGGLFFFSFLFAPRRGVLAGLVRRLRLTLRIAREHLLRQMLEAAEHKAAEHGAAAAAEDGRHWIARRALRLVNGWDRPFAAWVIRAAVREKLLVVSGDRLALTDAGVAEAERLTRNHRLWEEYLFTHGKLAASHVDYSADVVEHVLSPELVRELERALLRRDQRALPESLHPLTLEP